MSSFYHLNVSHNTFGGTLACSTVATIWACSLADGVQCSMPDRRERFRHFLRFACGLRSQSGDHEQSAQRVLRSHPAFNDYDSESYALKYAGDLTDVYSHHIETSSEPHLGIQFQTHTAHPTYSIYVFILLTTISKVALLRFFVNFVRSTNPLVQFLRHVGRALRVATSKGMDGSGLTPMHPTHACYALCALGIYYMTSGRRILDPHRVHST